MLKLKKESLKWALNQALNYGDTDIFPMCFEFKAIEHGWEEIERWLLNENILKWEVRPARRCITPKHQFGFRISTQFDPIDFLVFTALVGEIGKDIESKRVSVGDEIVFSYRFSPKKDGKMFDMDYNYNGFISKCKELVDSWDYSWVVVADIADFFPRLYHHRVINAIKSCTSKQNHALAIDNILNGLNESYSYGIPVGSPASRLISEIALDDVDRALLSEGTKYIRYSDDFRIFCTTKREAYEKLSFLAHILFENHGLTLQQSKTRIMEIDDFSNIYLSTESEEEQNKLSESFKRIIDDAGIDWYGEIEWDDLSPESQEMISKMNLNELLQEQLEKEEINIPLTRFLLRRLSQLKDTDSLNVILDNIELLYPVIPDVVRYILGLKDLSSVNKKQIGKRLLDLLLNPSIVSHLEFHRAWLLNLFTHDTEFNNVSSLSAIINKYSDNFTQRETILALGRAKKEEWFRMRKRNVFEFSPWTRRAFLLAGSCLPSDERKHWYDSLERRLDPLEVAITKWSRQNPF